MTERDFALLLKQIGSGDVTAVPHGNKAPVTEQRMTPADIQAFMARVKARSDHTRRILGG